MPEEKGFFTGAQEGLKLAIPLVLQKQRIDAAENRFQREMSFNRTQLFQNAIAAKDKILGNMYSTALGKAIETGDENLARNIMTSMQSMGYGGGFQIPEHLQGKVPTSLNALLAQGLQDKSPENILKIMIKLNESKKTASEKVPPDVAQARMIVSKLAQKIDPMTALMISLNPEMANNPDLKAKLDQAVPVELKPIYNKSIKILENYFGLKNKGTANKDPLGIR